MSKAARRERQRQNRAARRAYEERRAKRQRSMRTGRRVAIVAAPVLVVVIVVSILNSGGSSGNSVTCQPAKKPPAKTARLAKPPLGISPTVSYTAAIKTNCGTIDLALDTQQYPTAVNNFVALANQGFYDNMAFVRAAKGFVVQAGSPDQSNQTSNTGPGYTVQAEVPTTAPGGSAYPVGTVAFAKSGSEPSGSADSQFFIVTGNQGLNLTPNYAVIGRVTKGLNVAQKIASFSPSSGDGPPTTVVVIKSLRIGTGASPATTPST